jgi:hypothetical protein
MVEAAIVTALRSEPDQSNGLRPVLCSYPRHGDRSRCSAGATVPGIATFLVVTWDLTWQPYGA